MTHCWIRAWGASPHAPSDALEPVPHFTGTTLRRVVRVRVRFINESHTTGAARAGLSASGDDLTFSGRSTLVLSPARALADSVDPSLFEEGASCA